MKITMACFMKNAFAYLTILGLSSCFGKDPEKTGLEGKPLPAFNLLLADSTTRFNTASIPSGKPVVLFYFGPYCPYSRAQMEEILNHMESLNNIRFYLVTNYPFSDMKTFYTHYQLSKYPNITVGADNQNFFGQYFEARGFPYTAIYGKDKRLKRAFLGEVYSRQMKTVSED